MFSKTLETTDNMFHVLLLNLPTSVSYAIVKVFFGGKEEFW